MRYMVRICQTLTRTERYELDTDDDTSGWSAETWHDRAVHGQGLDVLVLPLGPRTFADALPITDRKTYDDWLATNGRTVAPEALGWRYVRYLEGND